MWREEKGRIYNVHIDCSIQPHIKRVKVYFLELRDYHDIHTVTAEKTETYRDQETCLRSQKIAEPEFVASLSYYNQTPTKVPQSLVCHLR